MDRLSESELISDLIKHVGVNAAQATMLLKGFYEAEHADISHENEVYVPSIGLKEYRRQMESALSALNRLENVLENIGETEAQHLENIYYDANERNQFLQNALPKHHEEEGKHGFSIVIHRLKKAVDHALSTLPKPGKGSSSVAKEFIRPLDLLATCFEKACPGYIASNAIDGKFHAYAQIWFAHFSKEEVPADLRYHIKNMRAITGR